MATKNHYNFSLIIACYNESKNIPHLFNEIQHLQKTNNFEVIIVNNGSFDNTTNKINENLFKIKSYKIVNIKKNIGFGNGIKQGLLKCTSTYVCYTHGDLQIKLSACIVAYNIFKESDQEIYVKSRRVNRKVVDYIFTFLMSLYNSFLFKEVLEDIHSQPNFFRKPSKNIIFSAPNDMLIDLYFFVFFKKKKIIFKRFDVYFKKRKFGEGSNDRMIKKFSYACYSLIKSFDVLKKINALVKS
jgi:glycosyltransferase involved in cell wall biosynthesis